MAANRAIKIRNESRAIAEGHVAELREDENHIDDQGRKPASQFSRTNHLGGNRHCCLECHCRSIASEHVGCWTALLDERSAANSYQMFLSVEPDGDVIGRVVEQFGAWVRGRKNWDPQLDANAFQRNADRDLLTLRHESSGGREFRARLTEVSPYGQWRTQLTVQVPASGTPWIALQVANSQGRWTQVPALAGFLLDTLTTKDGSIAMSSGARVVHAAKIDDLLEEICDPDRQGLFFVAGSGHEGGDFSRYVNQVERWTSQVRGLAQVVALTPDATDEAWRLLGPSHGIRSWTLRRSIPMLTRQSQPMACGTSS